MVVVVELCLFRAVGIDPLILQREFGVLGTGCRGNVSWHGVFESKVGGNERGLSGRVDLADVLR